MKTNSNDRVGEADKSWELAQFVKQLAKLIAFDLIICQKKIKINPFIM